MPHIEAIFFDLGDTLVELGEGRGEYEARLLVRAGRVYDLLAAAGRSLPEREAFCQALAEGCENRYQAALRQQRGLVIYDALRSFFAEMELPMDEELLAASAEAYSGHGGATTPLRPGARELLSELRNRHLRLGVISNTIQPGRLMDDSLARRGLLEFLDSRTYSSEVGVAKPHPAIFQAALAATGAEAGRAVHVGDRLWADVHGAQSVGMRAVLIEVPGRPETGAAIRPDACIRQLPELLAVLDQMD